MNTANHLFKVNMWLFAISVIVVLINQDAKSLILMYVFLALLNFWLGIKLIIEAVGCKACHDQSKLLKVQK